LPPPSYGFALRRIEEYGAILYLDPVNGTPSGTISLGDSRLVSTCRKPKKYKAD
jgi:hypothetical protein